MFTRTFLDDAGIQGRNGQNSFTFLFMLILSVLLLEKLEKRHCFCNLLTPQWNNSMWQTTHTAKTHAQMKFINSYLPLKKSMFAFSILKTHPSITCQQRNIHLNRFAGTGVRAERSDIWCMSNQLPSLSNQTTQNAPKNVQRKRIATANRILIFCLLQGWLGW